MIRHDHPCVQKIAALIEMADCTRHDSGVFGIAKQTRSVSLIQMMVDPRREVFVIFRFSLRRPWFRVILYPMIPFLLPLLEEIRRYRIAEPEGWASS
jgi:hypothetical protein